MRATTKALVIGVLLVGVIGFIGIDLWAAQMEAEAPKCRVKGDPLLIGAASFFIPGLGQFMNGEDGKGLMHLIVAVALPTAVLVSAFFVSTFAPPLAALLYLTSPVIYLSWAVYSAIDAYNVAAQYCSL